MPSRAYVAYINDIIKSFFGVPPHRLTSPSDRVFVARDKERPTYVYGWLLARDMSPGCAVVYCFTKRVHRRLGIASDLLATALEAFDPGPYTFAFRTRASRWFEGLDFAYQPVSELERMRGAA